jgi:hypothetical protein
MNMPGMVMHNSAEVKSTGTPGQYRATLKPDMRGDWMAKLRFDGPRGKQETTFPLSVGSGAAAPPAKPVAPSKVP